MPVKGFKVIFRRPLADGQSFGNVGPYEEIRGSLSYAIDPYHEANAAITDVTLAPRNSEGEVEFSTDISIMKPVDDSKSTGRMLLDVVNRGIAVGVPNFNRTSRLMVDNNTPLDDRGSVGDGFLMDMGYVVVACGWQLDAPSYPALMSMQGPEALDSSGNRLKGKVYLQLQSPVDTNNFLLSDKDHLPCNAAYINEEQAVVEIRDMPDGPAENMPRKSWRFGRIDGDGTYHADPSYICSEEGFKKGKLYQVVYTAIGAPVLGLSFAAIRDCASWIKHGTETIPSPIDSIGHVYAYGMSQTARFLRAFIYRDFNLDQQGREVIDGIIANVGGGNMGEFNQRFGQNSKDRNNTMHQLFPFASVLQMDPETEEIDSLHSRIEQRGSPIKVMYTNTSAEYHRGDASLIHTDPDGKRDVGHGLNTRVYHFSGAEHSFGVWPPSDSGVSMSGSERSQNIRGMIDYSPLLRACLVNMDDWVRNGVEPPPSKHPNLADDTLVHPSKLAKTFIRIPGAHYPRRHAMPCRRKFCPDSRTEHPNSLPPEVGVSYGGLVPTVNDDGNEIAGIVAPEISVPLAAHTGWTLRHQDVGGATQLLMYAGGTIPFARDEKARISNGDPRPSIGERYKDRDDYLKQVRVAADLLVAKGYLLHRDIEISISLASRMWSCFVEDDFDNQV